MTKPPLALTGLLRVALLLFCSATIVRSAVTFADIRFWAGAAPGPGINEAALVIDFRDGSPGIAWGFRWSAGETRTGQDMLAAILGADPALSVDSTVFPNSFDYGARSRSFSDNGTPADFTDDLYWGYWVNNNVFYHPTDFNLNSHIVPPATEVIPLGNPYGPGHWVESSTGAAARPLVNGSWDGWVYGPYLTEPGNALPAIPEPAVTGLAALALGLTFTRRKRRTPCIRRTRCAPPSGSSPHAVASATTDGSRGLQPTVRHAGTMCRAATPEPRPQIIPTTSLRGPNSSVANATDTLPSTYRGLKPTATVRCRYRDKSATPIPRS